MSAKSLNLNGGEPPELTFVPGVDGKKSARWTVNRLGHSSTLVGNYLFIFGGHNGTKYLSDVLLLNLGMMSVL